MARQHGATRLYVEADLKAGVGFALAADRAHYLKSVLRTRAGAELLLFNGRDGEWRGRLATLENHAAHVDIRNDAGEQTRKQDPSQSDIWLAFASVKRAAAELIVRQATELGAARLVPVATARTQARGSRPERLSAIAVSAAEQCGRLDIPVLAKPVTFDQLLDAWPQDRHLLLADETGGGAPLTLSMAAPITAGVEKWGLLIGPEGGFADSELDAARGRANLSFVDLGPRILRTDTAAAAGLAVLQSLRIGARS
ncbi:MAG: 16S rRNA (uracil(1498)-N(3))-methyltransferase [Alphaproteobacteria bacterium]|nr:16S rRNA (uracil(1498)-N(3))-methyltransferase [Alphaproteobacteria bacterium]